MVQPPYLGEFEQQVLLVIVRLGAEAFGPDVGRELEARAGRRVSRGALYTTFDRLEDKGLIRWRTVPGTTWSANGDALRSTRTLTQRQTKRRPAFWSIAPGRRPASSKTWNPLQIPQTNPPSCAKR